MQKHIRTRNLLQHIYEIEPLLKKLVTLGGVPYIMATMEYAVNAGNIESIKELVTFINQLSPELEDEIMTLAERLEAKGEARGQARGEAKGQAEAMRRVAASMLAKGLGADLVSEVTGLPIEIIRSRPATAEDGR